MVDFLKTEFDPTIQEEMKHKEAYQIPTVQRQNWNQNSNPGFSPWWKPADFHHV